MLNSSTHRVRAGLVIGLVNNMPPAAGQTTENHFLRLLESAYPGGDVKLRYFVPPEFLGGARNGFYRESCHEELGSLWDSKIDGLIITGAEPAAVSITDEPHWPTLARLVDWASDNTISTVWSCLAAQAAVFHLDGLERQPLPAKLSGVFSCTKMSGHRFVSEAPPCWLVPHSRHNTLDEIALAEKGYEILSYAPRVGVDMFVKQVRRSVFLFMLGHPEYGAETLLREYRRDVRRFIRGQRETYPEIPENYFDHDATVAFSQLRQQAREKQSDEFLVALSAAVSTSLSNNWRKGAVRLYASWLSYLEERKEGWAGLHARQTHIRAATS